MNTLIVSIILISIICSLCVAFYAASGTTRKYNDQGHEKDNQHYYYVRDFKIVAKFDNVSPDFEPDEDALPKYY